MKAKNILKALLAAALLLLPSLAFAQIFSSDNTGEDDVSVNQFLKPLFGDLVELGSGSNPLVTLIYEFNTGVLILAGILVFYTLVAGTLSTAHDGEMLGKRWSSMWVPIRTALGAAAIMPSIGGGYAVIQALVMWLALQGVSGANTLWSKYLENDPVADAFYVPPGATRQIRTTFEDMFLSTVCTVGFQEGQNTLFKTATAIAQAANIGAVTAQINELDGERGFAYGPMFAGCGAVEFYVATGTKDGSVDWGINEAPASASALVDEAAIDAALVAVHRKHLRTARNKLEEMAKQLIAGELTQEKYNEQMNKLIADYTDELKTTAKEQHDLSKKGRHAKLVEGMKKDGWAMAGMYYMAIIRAQDQITRAISETPTVSSGSVLAKSLGDDGVVASMANSALDLYIGSSERQAWFQSAMDLVRAGKNSSLTTVEAIGDDATANSMVMKLISYFVSSDGVLFQREFAQQGQNPIIMAKNLGENMTLAAWSGLIGGTLILGLSTVEGSVFGIGGSLGAGFASALSLPLFALFSLLVVPGATLSTYVPMIPYILWLGVIVGWVILVIEAIIAAPIWAMAHMAPDGDGVVGRGGQGYMLILSLVLRPPLMVLGLVCSIVLMKPLGYFVNSTFIGAFGMNVNPSPLGISQLLAGCVIYTVVMVSIIHRVFTLIHVIPDKILRWIGGGGNELGEQAQGMESFSTGKMVGMGAAMHQIGNVSEGVAKGLQHAAQTKKDKANSESIRQEESRSRMAQVEANTNDQAYRAGQDATRASATARATGRPEDRAAAAMSNEMARDARLSEAETKAEHALAHRQIGLGEFRALSSAEKQQEIDSARASDSPEDQRAADAMEFSRALDQAREQQIANPESNAMARFLADNMATAQRKGHMAKPWEVAAVKATEFEAERQEMAKPLEPKTPPQRDEWRDE